MVTINKKNIHLFYYFVWERQNVYYRRNVLKQKAPWTDDLILREYKFTNVHRSLDRTTIWYHDHIGGDFYKTGIVKFPKEYTEKDVVFATFIHRLINRIETMEKIEKYISVDTFSNKKVTLLLEDLRNTGVNIWTSAHMTTGVRFGGYDDKLYNIMHLINLIHENIDEIYSTLKAATSLEDLYIRSRTVQGFGPFLGYQFILDMINTGVLQFSHDDFSVAGPGCKRGLKRIFPKIEQIGFENGMKYLRKNQHRYFEKYGFDYKFLDELGGKEKGIHLADIENCCCEFSKYGKSYDGTGRPRNRFAPAQQLELL